MSQQEAVNQQYIPGPRRTFTFDCPKCGRTHHFKAGDPFKARCVDCGCYLTKMPPAPTERQEEITQDHFSTMEVSGQ